jgi:predicted RNA methylase
LARDFSLECHKENVIDLCAGIGMLSFCVNDFGNGEGFTCIEINPEYVEIGKKILPKANWIQADVLSDEMVSLSGFELAISNPPFGNISGVGNFEYAVIETAAKIAKYGVFILPQRSTPFKFSGNQGFERQKSPKYERFVKKTGIEFEFNCGIDTSICLNEWKGVSPLCEIVLVDFPAKINPTQNVGWTY